MQLYYHIQHFLTNKNNLRNLAFCALTSLFVVLCIMTFGALSTQSAYADPAPDTDPAPVIDEVPIDKIELDELQGDINDVDEIYDVVTTICQGIGVIFGIVGIVQYIMSHTNENGPEMGQAILMIAVGMVLILIPAILSLTDFKSVILSSSGALE